jgi:flagellar biosynthesis anti-sigma factor FlgM
MNTTDIVNEVARIMRQRDVSLKDPKETREIKAKREIEAPHDEVTLTSSAKNYASSAAQAPEYEKDQMMKVERLKSLVNAGQYKMDHQTVETIAERIANMLL